MWANAVLLSVSAICVVTDLRERKIYNAVIFPALLFAIAYHAWSAGWQGAAESLFGFFAGFGVLLIPYLLGGMGAGDVKMLAMVGALKGVSFVLAASVYMALIGGLLALGVLLFQNGLRGGFRHLGFLLVCLKLRMLPTMQAEGAKGTYPYGLAIAGGVFACMALKGWGAA